MPADKTLRSEVSCQNCGRPTVYRAGRCDNCYRFWKENNGHDKNVAFTRNRHSYRLATKKWPSVDAQIAATLRGDIQPLEIPAGVRRLSELEDYIKRR